MSAKNRVFSKIDRDSIRDAIEADSDRATEWVRKREEKRSYLDGAVDRELVKEAGDALISLSRQIDHSTQQELFQILRDLAATLSVWHQILDRPVNVKVAAEMINSGLETGLDQLAEARVWKRRITES